MYKSSGSENKWIIIRNLLVGILVIFIIMPGSGQDQDSIVIANIYRTALSSDDPYQNLKQICEQAAPRELGSENSIKAVYLLKNYLEEINCDTVFLQPYTTDVWKYVSGSLTFSESNGKEISYNVKALGPSVTTLNGGIEAEVIEVSGIAELNALEDEFVNGKIIFFNNKMDNRLIEPVNAYIHAVQPRLFGADAASGKGAVACIMRSISTITDEFVHTGCLRYNAISKNIPAVAISTLHADSLSLQIGRNNKLRININVETEILKDQETFNIIAEIRGKEKHEEVIVIGAHIDTWFNTTGAHDDGAGCVQMIDVLRIFQDMEIQNKRTIRVVLFMDEEMNKSGAQAYVEQYQKTDESFIAAIESDLGGFEPCGFLIDGTEKEINHIREFGKLLRPYGLHRIEKGFGGGDMIVLKEEFGFPSIALKVNSQRYFEIIHTEKDTFDKINCRELQLGSAAIASLVYLLDNYGFNLVRN